MQERVVFHLNHGELVAMGKPVQPMTLEPALGRAGAIELM
jgi:hypothetical protein